MGHVYAKVLQVITFDSVTSRTPLPGDALDRSWAEESPNISPLDEGYDSDDISLRGDSQSEDEEEDGCYRISSKDGVVVDERGGVPDVAAVVESGSMSVGSDDEDQGLEGGFVYLTDSDIDSGKRDDELNAVAESTVL